MSDVYIPIRIQFVCCVFVLVVVVVDDDDDVLNIADVVVIVVDAYIGFSCVQYKISETTFVNCCCYCCLCCW